MNGPVLTVAAECKCKRVLTSLAEIKIDHGGILFGMRSNEFY
jgi:hypothetical protein